MENIQYAGEALWIGQICKAFLFSGFVSAMLSVISYILAVQQKGASTEGSWKQMGKLAFMVHGVSILSLLAMMFYAMVNHHYEYVYVFDHVSGDLPMKYILSAFWEGQEGSFLLWMFWHIVIGFVLVKKDDQWHSAVMAMIALAEVWLTSMLLGIHIDVFGENYRIGSNPMMLLRDINAAPIFNNADYLSLIKGRGLNPLLQNYWMTIHPPTVFLAFALSIVPFAYAIAALWQRTFTEWLRAVLPWALMAAAILGISLIMGSLWAYEALSFGGYWAWDPVENTSLVPWIILVGGIHTNLMARATGHGTRSTFIFYIAGFLLIVYSTLLTRSGILGDTSAHAFTEMGLEWQLTFFLITFGVIGLAYYLWRIKEIPTIKKEESLYSREFWMYVGSLVLLFSAVLIDASSSLPVYNKIARYFDPSFVGNVIRDPITHYNKYQLWIAFFTGILSGLAVWLRYRNETSPKKSYYTLLGVHLVVALLATYLTSLWIQLPQWQYVLMAVSSWFAISSNLHYLVSNIRLDQKTSSAGIAHFGFGLMAIGLLASGLNYKNLSNPFLFKGLFADNGEEEKYIQLIKNQPIIVKDYVVSYEKDTLIGKARFYDIKFKQMAGKGNELIFSDSFLTRPNAVYANDFSKIAAFNPDTRHYWNKDIFTCVVSLPPSIADSEQAAMMEDSIKYSTHELVVGQMLQLKNGHLTITDIHYRPQHPEYQDHHHDVGFEIAYTAVDKSGKKYDGLAAIGLDGSILYKYAGKVENLGMRIRPGEKLMDQLLTTEDQLEYSTIKLRQNEEAEYNGMHFSIKGFDKKTDSLRYKSEAGDIAISGLVDISYNNHTYQTTPIFVIRDSAPMSIKDYVPELGLHVRLSAIDPQTGIFEMKMARDKRTEKSIPVEIAMDVPRSDYIVLEAKIFPGINLYWAGSVLMMIGLLMSWYFNTKSKRP